MTPESILALITVASKIGAELVDLYHRLKDGQEPTPEDLDLYDHARKLAVGDARDALDRLFERKGWTK